MTASCCQLTAGCPPESNPYPNPYPYPDSNPKFESGSVTNPYPIQAPGACAEERPRAGEQSLRHSLRCDTVPQFSMGASLRSQSSLERLPASLGLLRPASATGGGLRAPLFAKREAIDGAIPEDGVRPLAGESPRPASALPSEGAREAPREDGQSLRHGYAVPPFHSSTWSPRFVRKAHLRCSLFHWAYYGLFPPLAAAFVRPFGPKGRLLASATLCGIPLSKRLPLLLRGAVSEAD